MKSSKDVRLAANKFMVIKHSPRNPSGRGTVMA